MTAAHIIVTLWVITGLLLAWFALAFIWGSVSSLLVSLLAADLLVSLVVGGPAYEAYLNSFRTEGSITVDKNRA